jgi:GNAT superfamily N-acetyltransferase
MAIRILDVTEQTGFDRIPPCADPRFDHRTCDYWEDEVRGSKAHRASWLDRSAPLPTPTNRLAGNPFAPTSGPAFNAFVSEGSPRVRVDPFGDDEEAEVENPFAPPPPARPAAPADAPRKLHLLDRGLGVFGSYAKVLEVDDSPVAFCQFGPLSAYPRARRVRELYPRLPATPLPAVITCVATTPAARGRGLARELVAAVTSDLARRGFAAVEAYPEPEIDPDATSAANPVFWLSCGFDLAVDDPRFPVVRLELT